MTSPFPRALAALLLGATGIGFAPVLVRLSEVGPTATAVYRMLFALPFLWLWLAVGTPRSTSASSSPQATGAIFDSRARWLFVLAGLFFTGDLAVWHWSLQFTSVANSTLLTNFAPLLVTAGAWMFFHERISAMFIVGMVVALAGASLLVGSSVQFISRHVLGDALAIVTAFFYAGYLLVLKELRGRYSAVTIMAWSGLVSAIGLLAVALLSGDRMWPETFRGWMVLVSLGLVSHLGGQTLIAYAFGHLPASVSSLNLLLQPVVAAAAAWVALSEPLGWLQATGGIVVLLGIILGNRFGLRR